MLRFAPSPTGELSINSLRIAILNYLVAQQQQEHFLVRIEDMNGKKNIEGKDSEIMMILEKFALKHNAVFHQSEHKNLYLTLALRLLKEKKAFICTCTTTSCIENCETLTSEDYDSLKASAKKFVIRLKNTSSLIMDTEGIPSYDFACATDDMMSGIKLVIRDEQYLENTATQREIQKLLGYEEETSYVHIASILNKEKLPTLQWLLEEGFIPDAILNYLLLLGNGAIAQEIFTLPQAIEWFDLESISKSSPTFDLDKLQYINAEHLKLMDNKRLSTLFGFADEEIGKLAKVYLEEQCYTLKALESKIKPIFNPKDFSKKWGKEMKELSQIIFQAPYFEDFSSFKKHLKAQSDLEDDKLLLILRHLLTGTGDGPELSKIYPFIKSYILEVAS